MTTPTVELVPGDDFSLTVTLTDADGNAIDYSGWSVHTAEITWSDDTTTTLSVDLTNADTGVFVLTCADTETDGKRLGLVHELRLKLQSGAGLEKTVYYAEVKGVETLTSDTATGFVPGLSAGQVKELYEANSDTNAFTDAEQTKLSGIETGATADQTGAEIKALYEAEADTNAFTDAEKSKLAGVASGAEVNTVDSVNGLTGAVVLDPDDLDDTATTNKFTTAADISKLAGIETGATADQTGAEIKALYEAEADTNAYTDAEKSKLAGIEASADVTDAANVAAAGAVMDADFALNGLMKRTGAGTYDIVTDNSANWNTAYGWGDHAVEGYLTSVAVGDLTDWPASVSTTEVGYLDGVTSAIQTQLDGKAASSHSHAATDITSGTLADDRLPARLGSERTTDWNTEVKSGWYWSFQGANEPGVGAVWVGVVSKADFRITQNVFAVNKGANTTAENACWMRTSNNGGTTWDAWVQVFKTQPVLDARYAQLSGATFTGNVGIGTTATSHKLEVASSGAAGMRLRSDGGDSNFFNSTPNGANYIWFGDDSAWNAGWIKYTHATDTISFATNGAGRMWLNANGNLGIGNSNPADKLTVNGNVSATGTISGKLPSYTVATAPSASASGAGFQIYVTDETGGAVPAFSDGTNWRRVTDRSVIA